MGFGSAFCEASFPERSATRQFRYPLIDRTDANIIRLEATAIPFHDFAVLRMSRLCHCVEEVVETGQVADIFRRSAPVAINEARIFDSRIGVRDSLNGDLMLPVVAEVTGIVEGGYAAIYQGADPNVADSLGLPVHVTFRIRNGITLAAGNRLEEVMILEQHARGDVVDGPTPEFCGKVWSF